MPGQQGLSSREKILKAALKLFAERGFHKTPTLEIAFKAKVAEGTIFKHFGTKNNLLLELVEEININEITSLLKESNEIQKPTEEHETKLVLENFLKKHKNLIQENFPLFKVIIYEAQFFPELKEKFIEEVALKIFSPLESYIKEKSKSGEFKDYNPQIVSRAFIGMIISFIAWQDLLNASDYKNFNEIEVIEKIVELFLNGIKNN